MKMIRKHVIVSGRVQGVGFRYIAASIAAKYNVTGWVYNRFDGTVEIEVQGLEHRVDHFLEEVRFGNRFVRVDHMYVHDIDLVNVLKEKSFRVRY